MKVEFVSFLPGGETALKTFIDRAVRDPSILSEIAKSVRSSGPPTGHLGRARGN